MGGIFVYNKISIVYGFSLLIPFKLNRLTGVLILIKGRATILLKNPLISNMKKRIALLILIALVNTGIVLAQNTIAHATISFKIKNLGVNTNGTLGGLQAVTHFNPADLTTSTLEATVEVSTVNTDNSKRDEHLKSEDFFDFNKYPKISLKSVSFKHKSGSNYTGIFNLTIKDKTKQVEIPFIYTDKGATVAFTGTFKINRLDYGVGSSSMILSDEVTVTIDAEATK